ncbi:hypothetical protein M427DRAFT_51004 [Gonapodya prolifera JEL478]|uniref:Uncharacterized protein n=1 Tax=Gonapodya prolifera (strain JEL478) TaxID=1344416 RepID=A0A139AXY8_GONPJ|nr:hypothetical protein M427DRAFT_51004 [Gonapodya prolifera JEL478]|eukprot:KXS21580.1 hypothetical protein M427DRAFT_51004 [Gonapodya prolifera JEL478]
MARKRKGGAPEGKMDRSTIEEIVDQTGILNGAKLNKVRFQRPGTAAEGSDSEDDAPLSHDHDHDHDHDHEEEEHDPNEEAIRESEAFSAIVYAVPLTIAEATLHHIVLDNFKHWSDYNMTGAILRSVAVYAFVVAMIYFTSSRKEQTWMQVLFAGVASGAGCTLVYFAEVDKTLEAALIGTRVAVIWVYCIIQGNLLVDLSSLLSTAAYFAYLRGGRLF